jgi:hypothetical protein
MAQRVSYRGALFLLVLSSVAPPLFAAPPQAEQFFPPGGQLGQTVEIDVVGKFERWPPQVWVSRAGLTLTPIEKKGKFTAQVAPDATPGACWVRLYDHQGASSPIPWIVGTLPEQTEVEPNDRPEQAPHFATDPIVINGRLQARGDVDHFALHVSQGAVLVAEIESHCSLGSPLDATLQIVSTDGFVLAHNDDDRGLDPRIAFVAPRAGTYVVRVLGFPAAPNSSIALAGGPAFVYRLTITTHALLDYALPLAVRRNSSQTIELFGWNLPEESTQIEVVTSGRPEQITLSDPRFTNRLSLPVIDHLCLCEQEPNDRETATPVEIPFTLSGRIAAAGDEDCVRFSAKAGEKFFISVESRMLGFPLDPVLEVFTLQGKSLARVDDMGDDRDAAIDFTVPADGEYVVSLSDLHRSASPRHVYRLTVRRSEPDFQVTLADDHFSVKAGETLEIPVTVNRLYGFDQEIAIEALDLPPGARCEPVVSAAEGDSSKSVNLAIKTTSAPYSGVVRVVGRTTGAEPVIRQGAAAVAGKPLSLAELWLTVTSEKQ